MKHLPKVLSDFHMIIVLDVEWHTYSNFQHNFPDCPELEFLKSSKHKQDAIWNISYLVLDKEFKIIKEINIIFGGNSVDNKMRRESFQEDLNNATCLITHNLKGDLRVLEKNGYIIPDVKTICTYQDKLIKNTLQCKAKNGANKGPSLKELCAFCEVDLSKDKYHQALYDVHLLYQCLVVLDKKGIVLLSKPIESPDTT